VNTIGLQALNFIRQVAIWNKTPNRNILLLCGGELKKIMKEVVIFSFERLPHHSVARTTTLSGFQPFNTRLRSFFPAEEFGDVMRRLYDKPPHAIATYSPWTVGWSKIVFLEELGL
jgi:hypothetical protein